METSWKTPTKEILSESIPIDIPGMPDFDLEAIASKVSSALELPLSNIECSFLTSGASRPSSSTHFPLYLQLSPLKGGLELWMEKRVKEEILSTYFAQGPVSQSISDSFWTFTCAKALSCICQEEALAKFFPQVLNHKGRKGFSLEGAGQMTLSLEIAGIHFKALLLCSEDFIASFKQDCLSHRTLRKKAPIAKEKGLIKLSARVGSLTIEAELLKKLATGDWLALDKHHFEGESPVEAELYLKKKRVAKGSLQSGEINITKLDL